MNLFKHRCFLRRVRYLVRASGASPAASWKKGTMSIFFQSYQRQASLPNSLRIFGWGTAYSPSVYITGTSTAGMPSRDSNAGLTFSSQKCWQFGYASPGLLVLSPKYYQLQKSLHFDTITKNALQIFYFLFAYYYFRNDSFWKQNSVVDPDRNFQKVLDSDPTLILTLLTSKINLVNFTTSINLRLLSYCHICKTIFRIITVLTWSRI
jgi:hypothetical protein